MVAAAAHVRRAFLITSDDRLARQLRDAGIPVQYDFTVVAMAEAVELLRQENH